MVIGAFTLAGAAGFDGAPAQPAKAASAKDEAKGRTNDESGRESKAGARLLRGRKADIMRRISKIIDILISAPDPICAG